MKQLIRINSLIFFSVFPLLFSACGQAAANEDQIAIMAQNLVSTRLAQTLAAQPSNTQIPTETPQPTNTSTQTPFATLTETPTATIKLISTWAPYGQPDSGAFETARADKSSRNAPLLLDNRSGERIQFILVSPQYQEYVFTDSLGLVLPQGQYNYRAWIGNDGPFSGSFTLNNPDKHILIFYSDKIHFSTP